MVDEKEFRTAFYWCVKREIYVWPKQVGKNFILIYSQNKIEQTSGKKYTKSEYDDKVKEFYIYLYKKHKDVSS